MPEIRRFTTRDEYRGEASDPTSMHRYAYCGNDPINYIDPMGTYHTAASINGAPGGGSSLSVDSTPKVPCVVQQPPSTPNSTKPAAKQTQSKTGSSGTSLYPTPKPEPLYGYGQWINSAFPLDVEPGKPEGTLTGQQMLDMNQMIHGYPFSVSDFNQFIMLKYGVTRKNPNLEYQRAEAQRQLDSHHSALQAYYNRRYGSEFTNGAKIIDFQKSGSYTVYYPGDTIELLNADFAHRNRTHPYEWFVSGALFIGGFLSAPYTLPLAIVGINKAVKDGYRDWRFGKAREHVAGYLANPSAREHGVFVTYSSNIPISVKIAD